VDVRDGMWIASIDVASRRMMIGKRPMDQVEVKVFDLQVSKGFLTRRDDVVFAVFVVPELRRDPNLLATEFAQEEVLEYFTDLLLVAVNGCAIKVAISD
jgi:hypothetical protein